MNNKVAIVFVVLALLLGAGAWNVLKQEGASSSTAQALGQPLFPNLKVPDIARIEIRDGTGAITLDRKDGRWVVAERGGYPADLDRVTDLVVKTIELKTGQFEPIGEKDRPRMQLAAPGKGEGSATVVTFKGTDGKALAELWVGKKYFRTPPEGDISKAQGDGRFVMLPADPAKVIVVSDPLRQATTTITEWVAREGFVVENIKTLEVKRADGGYRLERDNLDATWKLDGKGGELDGGKANAATFALAKLEIEDVPAAGFEPGFDAGSSIVATTFDGLTYQMKVGRLEKDRYALQVTVEGDAKREVKVGPAPPDEKPADKEKREKAAADDVKKFQERIAREKAMVPFVVQVVKAKLDEVLKTRADLLKKEEKKDDGKKDERKGAKK